MTMRTLAAVGGALVMLACSGEDTSVATVGQAATCHNPDGYYGMMAALASAMANDLGTWEATTHLKHAGWRNVQLTDTAKARCAARQRGACSNSQAVLSMQQVNYITAPDGKRVFDGTQFYQQLKVYLERQRILESRTGTSGCGPRPHTLVLQSLAAGACSLDHNYRVTMQGSPSTLACKLTFAGYPENQLLAFRSTATTVIIDPASGMLDDVPATTSTCSPYYVVYDPEGSEVGADCCPDGYAGGHLAPSTWSSSTLVCTW